VTAIGRAIWYIESHLDRGLSLAEIAAACGVSRYHLARTFMVATGHSVMRYARHRKMSEAAKRLSAGERDILSLALDYGYGSHEAFTRAFQDQFGRPPSTCRAAALSPTQLLEPLTMTGHDTPPLPAPRYEEGPRLHLAGLKQSYARDQIAGIPGQWQKFAPYIGAIDGQRGDVCYGVCAGNDDDDGMTYMTAVEIAEGAEPPQGLDRLVLAPRRYAVFEHRGHIAEIGRSWNAIFAQWLPRSGRELTGDPEFERYDARFDPATGNGPVEIWIPIGR